MEYPELSKKIHKIFTDAYTSWAENAVSADIDPKELHDALDHALSAKDVETPRVLVAFATPNNTIARRLEVWDMGGRAYIVKTFPNNRVIEWLCDDRTPAEWIGMNPGGIRRGDRPGWKWSIAVDYLEAIPASSN